MMGLHHGGFGASGPKRAADDQAALFNPSMRLSDRPVFSR
jgi:hypothetical protein